MKAVLTLQIPKGTEPSVSIAMTANPDCLAYFKATVLDEQRQRLALVKDEVEAVVRSAELERLRKVLDLLIPDNVEADHENAASS